MNYDPDKNKYKLDLEETSIYLSVPFVEQTKLKEFIGEDKSIIVLHLLNAQQVFLSSSTKKALILRLIRALIALDSLYSKEKSNFSIKEFLTIYNTRGVALVFEQLEDHAFSILLGNFYTLLLLIDYLNIPTWILLRNDEWLNIVEKVYNRMSTMSDYYKNQYIRSMKDIIPLIEKYSRSSILPLGQLLLRERRTRSIFPTRNILTKGPNDSTGLNLHNVMYSLRTDE